MASLVARRSRWPHLALPVALAMTVAVLWLLGPVLVLTYDADTWYGEGSEPVFGIYPAILAAPAVWAVLLAIGVVVEILVRSAAGENRAER